MKRYTLCVAVAFMLFSFIPMQMKAVIGTNPVPVAAPVESAEVNALTLRLTEIQAINKSTLSSDEKKELRQETRSIKKQLKALNRGVYISLGSVIIIVLLLILLL
ncbi:MAG: hypothetical protein IPJ74_12805 [Saprospiraceae bacterium]|nr:hypothetical protein [Saprospiraceae bacterium]